MTATVSIIVPCYNEEKTIRTLLDAILAQTYPLEKLDVVIADGFSEDRTREEIAAFQAANPSLNLRLVDNPKRIIPAGLNTAIRASRGEILVRLDAHSAPQPDYITLCVQALQEGRGDNVGGVWDIRPGAAGCAAASIAAAAAHPLGVGDALYRHAVQAQEVDTVPFGAFRRALLDEIGYFDESLLANEDYEFNTRIRQAGGIVWLDPAIRSVYFSRPTYRALAKQYFNYGYWKWQMLRRYPKSLRWRQALPPLLVLSLIILFVLSFFSPFFSFLLGLEIFAYLLILFLAALQKKRLGLPFAIATMHISWGSGLLRGVLSSPFKAKKNV